jgi:mRNA-decapping enzyme subunit 2
MLNSKLGIKNIFDELMNIYIYHLDESIFYNKIQICFQLQYAYWCYLDNYVKHNNLLPRYNQYEFFHAIVNMYPLLYLHIKDISKIYTEWKEYISCIPVYGSIILDSTLKYCLLLRMGSNRSSHYSFPKGKIDKGEEEVECAIRETMEETGINIRNKIRKTRYIDGDVKGKYTKLYMI